MIFDTLGIKTPLHSCSVKDFPVNVKRPFYSVLENQRFNAIGYEPMPNWHRALKKFLRDNYL
ncbi:sugar nucleotide-binding protein [candidate division TA06 bacterium]|nr:sugar nucleotide-binding protein [candidate division TA06 bacterium]